MNWLDLVAVPVTAKVYLVGMFPLSTCGKAGHRNEAMRQAALGPLPFPAVLVVLGIVAFAPAAQMAPHPLSSGPQVPVIVR